MKQQNQTRALFDAVTDVEAEWIEAANRPGVIVLRQIVTISATVAVVAIALFILLTTETTRYVTSPNMLTIRGYALNHGTISSENSAVMEEGIEFPLEFAWSQALSCSFGLPIHLFVTDETLVNSHITWEISVQDGEFYLDSTAVQDQISEDTSWLELAHLGNHFTVDNDTLIQWTNDTTIDASNIQIYGGESNYVDAIIRADGHIIGYAVIEIRGFDVDEYTNQCTRFLAVLIDSNYYPMVDGEFQDVSLAFVKKQLFKAKLIK